MNAPLEAYLGKYKRILGYSRTKLSEDDPRFHPNPDGCRGLSSLWRIPLPAGGLKGALTPSLV